MGCNGPGGGGICAYDAVGMGFGSLAVMGGKSIYEAGCPWNGFGFLGVRASDVYSKIGSGTSSLFRRFWSRSGFRGLCNSERFREGEGSKGRLGEERDLVDPSSNSVKTL